MDTVEHYGAITVFLEEKKNFMHHLEKIMITLQLEGPNGQFLLAPNKILLQKVPCLENPGMESQPANSQRINSRTARVEGSGEAFGAHKPGHLQAAEHVFITCQDLQNSKLLGIRER